MDELAKQIIAIVVNRLIGGRLVEYDPAMVTDVAAALQSFGAERARAERREIEQEALAIRADYPEDVFPTLPAAVGARLVLDRLLSFIRALPD